MKYTKVIIWGHPLYSHTHSYVHEAYYKAFKRLGYDVYWFHDNDYPVDFDFSNCLFIGEGFADKQIPINKTSCYCIMYCPNPAKYAEAERYIDLRTVGFNVKDHVHDYSLNKSVAINIGPGCYFESKQNKIIHHKNQYVDQMIPDYDIIYISWATNLLPEEIDFNDMYKSRDNDVYFCGTLSQDGVCENLSNFLPFIEACRVNNIRFIHNDPWSNPLSSVDVIKYMQKSLLGIDIRGPEHLRTQVVTCRIFKNISYGHLGLTNSPEIYAALDGNCVLNSDTAQLFYDGMDNRINFPLIERGMQYVKDYHTYINRIQSILSVL